MSWLWPQVTQKLLFLFWRGNFPIPPKNQRWREEILVHLSKNYVQDGFVSHNLFDNSRLFESKLQILLFSKINVNNPKLFESKLQILLFSKKTRLLYTLWYTDYINKQ